MFSENADSSCPKGEDHRVLGSQYAESYARGLPTGTQSQTDVHPMREPDSTREVHGARYDAAHETVDLHGAEEPSSREGDRLETEDFAGNISFGSDGSSIPPFVDDFFGMFSQPGAHRSDDADGGDGRDDDGFI